MTAERHERLGQLFLEASRLPAAAREAFLEVHCAGDAAVRRDILEMLAHDEESPSVQPIAEGSGRAILADALTLDLATSVERVGDTIGRYRLTEKLGTGGFGVVYAAEQIEPVRRTVALKIIKLGMDTREVIARFGAERQALAMMDHPGIARVYDAGAMDQGRPYFVMELVSGVPITEYCDARRLRVEERLALFRQVCAAVQHAHQKGIIHRDIKPSNVLVSEQDGRPVPKIIDFGIAKATDTRGAGRAAFTAARQFIGTPEYMSPEQASTGEDVDSRSDVYSLGVLLYELLTGTTPFEAASLRRAAGAEVQRIIIEDTPPTPSARLGAHSALSEIAARRHVEPKRLGGLIRGDLDWIVMKAIEKDRSRRYDSATGLAEDIQRYLESEPVVASPPSRIYRIRKFARRHRSTVVAAVAIGVVLVAGATGTTIGMVAAIRAAARADVNAANADRLAAQASTELGRVNEVKRFLSGMLAAVDPGIARRLDTKLMERILLDATARLEEGAITDEVIEAELRSIIAGVYIGLGQFDAAAPFADRARDIREHRLGDDHPDTLASLHQTAVLMHYRGELAAEEPLIRRVVDGRRRLLGDDARATIESITEYGALLIDLGRYDDAEAPVLEAMERSRRALGPDAPQTCEAIQNVGRLRDYQRRDDEAERWYRESIDAFRRSVGPDHPATTTSMHNLATLLKRLKRYDEAEAILNEELAIARRVLGNDHPDVWASEFALGSIASDRGDLPRAERLLREAHAGFRQTLGNDHRHTLSAATNLANVLYKMGRLDDAIGMAEFVRDARVRGDGPEHPATVSIESNLGFLYGEAGRHAEAEACLRVAVAGRTRLLGPDDPLTLRSVRDLARALAAQHKYEEAESTYVNWLATWRRVSEDTDPIVLNAMTEVGQFELSRDRLEAAEARFRDALDGAARGFGLHHELTRRHLHRYVEVLVRLGRSDEALALTEAEIQVVDASDQPPDESCALVRLAHAEALAGLGRWPEAESQYIGAHAQAQTALGADHARLLWYRNQVADFYDAWSRADPDGARAAHAAEWRSSP